MRFPTCRELEDNILHCGYIFLDNISTDICFGAATDINVHSLFAAYSGSITKPKVSYAELVAKAQVMVSGLKNNAQEVQKRGIDSEFTTLLEKQCEEVIALNNEQERLKAELKAKTEEFVNKLNAINEQMREATKVTKLAIPQARWREFGIETSR